MGAPKKEIVKKRNTFTLSKTAQDVIDGIPGQNKSRVVSYAIIEFFKNGCQHKFVPVAIKGYRNANAVECIFCDLMKSV